MKKSEKHEPHNTEYHVAHVHSAEEEEEEVQHVIGHHRMHIAKHSTEQKHTDKFHMQNYTTQKAHTIGLVAIIQHVCAE